ncbi:DUF1311 domain-containing protein [Lichenibacterium minor]|uniref:DUF1311 domain-containing protein n=2 Tax=Lichenibacterium minor TaxID=2316528 RepID=A0A4Q2U4X3_9HYPH|nr:DUF1311 domain-containing protein [Lichenibacterium minor]
MRMGSGSTGLVAGALALLAGAGPLRAEDCAKAATQTDLNICAGQARAAADAALNATYGALVAAPTMADRLDRLRAAERAWVGYRDAQCAFEGARFEGGSMQPMAVDGCAEALTRRRTTELREALACAKEGGPC